MARETRDPSHDGSPTSHLASASKAISPVIGVILMVLITVALAAIIGTFVLNLGSAVQANAVAGVAVDCQPGAPGTVQVTWTDNHNADRVTVAVSGDAFASLYEKALLSVGASTGIQEDDGTVSDDQTAKVVVSGENDDSTTVLVSKDCEV